jgi:hypothetical protein
MQIHVEGIKPKLTIGMEWSKHDTAKEAKDHLKETPNASWVLRAIDDRQVLGIAKGDASNTTSGALLFAALVQTGILMHPVSETHTWLCAVVDGVPLAGSDIVVPKENARREASQALSFSQSSKLYGVSTESVATFETLLTGAHWDNGAMPFEKALKRFVKENGLQRKNAKRLALLACGGAISLCLAVGAAYLMMAKEEAAPANAQRDLDKAKALAVAKESIERVKQEFADKVKQDRERASSGLFQSDASVDSWLAVIDSLPRSRNGYKVSSVKCTRETCDVYWQAASVGRVLPIDKLNLPGQQKPMDSGLTAKTSFPLVTSARAEKEDCNDAAMLRIKLASLLMQFDTGASVTVPADLLSVGPELPAKDLEILRLAASLAPGGAGDPQTTQQKLADVRLGQVGKWQTTFSRAPKASLRAIKEALAHFPARATELAAVADFKQITLGGEYVCLLPAFPVLAN